MSPSSTHVVYVCCCHVKGLDTIADYRKGLQGILVAWGT